MTGGRKAGGTVGSASSDTSTLKIKLRGRDNAPLSMRELREALLEAALKLKDYEAEYRAKSATIYLTIIDEYGRPVLLNYANELTIYPYKAAADEHGL